METNCINDFDGTPTADYDLPSIVIYAYVLRFQSYNRIWCLKEFEVCGVPC